MNFNISELKNVKPAAGRAFLPSIIIMKKISFLFAVLLSLAGCKSTPGTTAQGDIPGIDSSTKPVNNFLFVCKPYLV